MYCNYLKTTFADFMSCRKCVRFCSVLFLYVRYLYSSLGWRANPAYRIIVITVMTQESGRLIDQASRQQAGWQEIWGGNRRKRMTRATIDFFARSCDLIPSHDVRPIAAEHGGGDRVAIARRTGYFELTLLTYLLTCCETILYSGSKS